MPQCRGEALLLIYIKAQGAGMTNEASTPDIEGYQAHLGLFNLI